MLFSAPKAHRAMAGALGAGALAGVTLFGAVSTASAQPIPPNCTAADFAGVAAGVSAASSAYLFTHPEVNDFFTSIHGLPEPEIALAVEVFFDENPEQAAQLTAIRQPLVDIRDRCGFALGGPNDPDAAD